MSRYDATQTNESTRSSKIFKDLNLDFQQNTATKDIQKITFNRIRLQKIFRRLLMPSL